MRIVINGFGRIGRTILRQLLGGEHGPDIEVVAINDIASAEMCAYLFQYDSTFGPYRGHVAAGQGTLEIDGQTIALHQTPDITALDLSGVDVVLECTGIARSSDVARRGLTAGARKVLISGPSPAAQATIVMGANDETLSAETIVSNASCTTNGLAPLVRLVDGCFGLETAHMTTIHCYTNSQPMVDAPRGDFARSRAGAMSMVPTTTSAMTLIDTVLPALAGRVSGAALRVPTASVSSIDLVAQVARDVDPAALAGALKAAVDRSAVLGWTDAPLVSSDLRAAPQSLVLAAPEIRQIGRRQIRLFGWYDNEWGFSARMIDVARLMAARP